MKHLRYIAFRFWWTPDRLEQTEIFTIYFVWPRDEQLDAKNHNSLLTVFITCFPSFLWKVWWAFDCILYLWVVSFTKLLVWVVYFPSGSSSEVISRSVGFVQCRYIYIWIFLMRTWWEHADLGTYWVHSHNLGDIVPHSSQEPTQDKIKTITPTYYSYKSDFVELYYMGKTVQKRIHF